MVERIILFKLNEPATRDEVAALTQALANLANVEELSVGVPADAACEKSWDLSMVLGAANLALLNTVLESPGLSQYLDV